MELERILLFIEMRKNQISNQDVRLIEIQGHDVAACALEHASSLRECEFFLVTRIARAEGDLRYEIDFVVKLRLRRHLCHSRGRYSAFVKVSANTNTLEDTVKKLIVISQTLGLRASEILAKFWDISMHICSCLTIIRRGILSSSI